MSLLELDPGAAWLLHRWNCWKGSASAGACLVRGMLLKGRTVQAHVGHRLSKAANVCQAACCRLHSQGVNSWMLLRHVQSHKISWMGSKNPLRCHFYAAASTVGTLPITLYTLQVL